MERKRQASVALVVILIAATIAIVAFVMANGSTPIGPAIPSGGGNPIEGWNQLTPVVPTVAAINCQNGTIICSDGGSGVLNLAVVTPTPQPTATPGGGGTPLNDGLPIPDGSTPADTAFLGVPGAGFTSTGGGDFVTANDIYYEPYNVSQAITVNQLSFLVTSAGAAGNACRVGIYEADNEFQPTDLVIDAGQVINDTTGWKHVSVNVVLAAGNYVNAIICNSSPALGDHAAHTYLSGLVSSATTSSSRFVRNIRDANPPGTPYSSGFSDPSNAPFDTVNLGNEGSFVHYVLMRWSVN